MNTRRKSTVLTLLFVLIATFACKKTDLFDPGHSASDRDARSAVSDTVSVPEKPAEPVEVIENNIPPSDTTSVPGEPKEPAFVSLADEKFLIRAEAPDSLKGAGIFLTLISERDLGCGDSYFSIQPKWGENSPIEIRIGNLVLPNDCAQKIEKATGRVLLYPVLKGENILRIHIGEKSFEGKIIYEGTRYLFEWPDESQFKFSDKVLNF